MTENTTDLLKTLAREVLRGALEELDKDTSKKNPEPEDSAPEENPEKDAKTFAEEVCELAGIQPSNPDHRLYLWGMPQTGNRRTYPLERLYDNTMTDLEETTASSLVRGQTGVLNSGDSIMWEDVLLRDTLRVMAQEDAGSTRAALLDLAVTVNMWADTLDGKHK